MITYPRTDSRALPEDYIPTVRETLQNLHGGLAPHAQKVLVKTGDPVTRGQPIALLGRTGNATTEHCHFEIRIENRAIDPMTHLLGTTEARR